MTKGNSGDGRALAATPSSPQAVSPLRAAIPVAWFPLAPETCEVLGNRPRGKDDPLWAGLRFNGDEVVRAKSTLMLALLGKDAPYDLHLDVPWEHPDDYVDGEAPDCVYRVRPRMEPGKKWRGRKVRAVAIERDDTLSPPWKFRVEYVRGYVSDNVFDGIRKLSPDAAARHRAAAAQAIEARRAETETGSVADESAVGNADAPKE